MLKECLHRYQATQLQDKKESTFLQTKQQHICTQTCSLKEPQPQHKQRPLPEI